jgi:peptidyl-prolyl cis-trans isomerase SurA
MVKKIGILVAIVMCTLTGYGAMPAPSSTVTTLDRVVAIVNNDVVTESQLKQALRRAKARMQQAHMALPPKANFRATVLEQLVDRSLQLQLAKKMGLKVTNAQLHKFMVALARQQGVSVSQWKQKMRVSSGYTSAELLAQLKDQFMINQVQSVAVVQKIKLNATTLKKVKAKFAEQAEQSVQYNITDYRVLAQADNKSTNLIARRLQAQLSRAAESTLPSGIEKNEMGWLSVNQLPAVFFNAVQSLKPGAVSKVIKADNGMHVLVLKAKRGSSAPLPTDQQIKNYAMQQQFVVDLAKWVKTLRQSAFIKILHS